MAYYPPKPGPVIVRGGVSGGQVADIDAELTTQTAHLSAIETATERGNYDDQGHQEIAIHGPLLPFRSVHTESITPVFQSDAVYGINTGQVLATTSGSGTATATNSAFVASTGTTVGSQGIIQSRKRLRYRAGQGLVGRFAGLFTTPVASSYQLAGFGHAEDGVYFGYVGTSFGILYVNRGCLLTRN